MSKQDSFFKNLKSFWKSLGPGLITGASDDDPSAITTFSQAGAQYGIVTLWMAILAFPILAFVQEICARIGIVTGKGITGVVKQYYPSWLLYLLIILSCPPFVLNIGADIAVMGEASNFIGYDILLRRVLWKNRNSMQPEMHAVPARPGRFDPLISNPS